MLEKQGKLQKTTIGIPLISKGVYMLKGISAGPD
jgi:hypothetical protein